MMLTGEEIIRLHKEGVLHISPFDRDRVNPNSYDLSLHPKVLRLEDIGFDIKNPPKLSEHVLTDEGMFIYPGHVYLGCTNEEFGSDEYVPCIEGKSSIARYGVDIHKTAGFGDLGFKSRWTLEITTVRPFKLYPHMKIAQGVFWAVQGTRGILYRGKYQDQSSGPVASRGHQDFSRE